MQSHPAHMYAPMKLTVCSYVFHRLGCGSEVDVAVISWDLISIVWRRNASYGMKTNLLTRQ